MLIYHFEAETHSACRGLMTKMAMGKPESLKNHISERNLFEGGPAFTSIHLTGHIINENIFVFDLAGGQTEPTSFSGTYQGTNFAPNLVNHQTW